MNDPQFFYLPCPNPGCPSRETKGKRGNKQPVVYIKEEEVILDSSFEERGVRIAYRCSICQHRFYKP